MTQVRAVRILLTTFHQAFLTHGGGETELRQLVDYIGDLGVRADLYGPTSRPLKFYDAVIHFSAHGGGEQLLGEIKASGIPIVLIANFNFFDVNHSARDVVQRHLDLADRVVLRTSAERDLCLQNFAVDPARIVVVPAGISDSYAKPVEDDLFRSAYALDRYILSVGQIEEGKEQLRIIEALSAQNLPLVFIGGHSDKVYFEQCRRAANDKARFLPYLQPGSDILRSAVQSCDAYIELGQDYPGFSALEAALAGRPLVLNDHPWSREVLGDAPHYVKAKSLASVSDAMQSALQANNQTVTVARIRSRHVQPGPTRQLLEVVQSLVGR